MHLNWWHVEIGIWIFLSMKKLYMNIRTIANRMFSAFSMTSSWKLLLMAFKSTNKLEFFESKIFTFLHKKWSQPGCYRSTLLIHYDFPFTKSWAHTLFKHWFQIPVETFTKVSLCHFFLSSSTPHEKKTSPNPNLILLLHVLNVCCIQLWSFFEVKKFFVDKGKDLTSAFTLSFLLFHRSSLSHK